MRPGDPGLGAQFGELDACPPGERMVSGAARSTGSFMISTRCAVGQHQWRIHPVIDQSNIQMSRNDQAARLVQPRSEHG
jgi:hypothetical protein